MEKVSSERLSQMPFSWPVLVHVSRPQNHAQPQLQKIPTNTTWRVQIIVLNMVHPLWSHFEISPLVNSCSLELQKTLIIHYRTKLTNKSQNNVVGKSTWQISWAQSADWRWTLMEIDHGSRFILTAELIVHWQTFVQVWVQFVEISNLVSQKSKAKCCC